jgi:hypothetical protein
MSAEPILPELPDAHRTLRVNIIGKSNGVGLARDLDLLARALQCVGHEVSVTIIDARQAKLRRSLAAQLKTRLDLALQRWRVRDSATKPADLNLMIEHVWLQYLAEASLNIAVPNPEWFDRHDRHFLRNVDIVWAKTGYTQDVFSGLGSATAYIGFDSEDRYDGSVVRTRSYFHLAGKSTMKGTDRLLAVWRRHPEWPKLIVIQHKHTARAAPCANIDLKVGYLTDEQLKRLQNESVFHLCTSLTEGWGHYIVEALGVGAVTITVDAAPMNELVTDDRGLLVPYRAIGQQRLATTYQFDETAFEATIERTLAMSDAEYRRIGANARRWFVSNKEGFANRVNAALQSATSLRASGTLCRLAPASKFPRRSGVNRR